MRGINAYRRYSRGSFCRARSPAEIVPIRFERFEEIAHPREPDLTDRSTIALGVGVRLFGPLHGKDGAAG